MAWSRSKQPRSLPIPSVIAQTLDSALDKAIAVQAPTIAAYLDRLARTRPEVSPAELIAILERRYLIGASAIGAAAGSAAAIPGVGTTASIASAALEITAFVEATALFALSVAHVHGVRTEDPNYRRSLVLGVLLGGTGVELVEQVAGTRARWGQVLAKRGSEESLGRLNHLFARHLLTKFGAGQSALVIGRALPLGLGAGIGAIGNASLARAAIKSTRTAFGPPPDRHLPQTVELE